MPEDSNWLEISIDTTQDRLDVLTAQLTGNGVTGLVIEDEADFRRFLEENRACWDYVDDALLARMQGVCRVKFYVTDDADGQGQLAQWMAGIDLPYATCRLAENDWAHSWQKYYKPLPAGESLYIVPEWERSAEIPAGRTPLYLNPGLTFGTGGHASTQLCLAGVERYISPDCHVLDLGCGSGILSIAALALGAASAVAVDIDPKAVGVAYENAALNGINENHYTVRSGNILADATLMESLCGRQYELVLANIVADVIIPLSREVARLLTPQGVFLCSGIIDSRAAEVSAALRQNGLTVVDRWEHNGWVAFSARRSE
ncbi:MAG: 50S ribosomal protein L11 methyltransferase [Oscillospiraceae bacterium]|nr:50S ribosomal protein L11 methyltransferase [Oscillospiraceae bacterium]